MTSDVYIFGYQSMLAEGSLATSIGSRDAPEDYVPARLRGYARDWGAVRDFSNNPRKRYVHAGDWRPAGRVAFATLGRDPGGSVNGVCHRVAADRLDELDFREQGYRRQAVNGALSPYPGHVLDMDLPCYAYIDPHPDPVPAPVSRAYYDMGRLGAAAIDARAPGFAADYLASTRPPPVFADDLAFVFFSGDGRHLWLLNEADSSLVLLLAFAQPQFEALTDSVPEARRPVTAGLEWLDARGRGVSQSASPRIPAAMADELLRAEAARLAASPYWLCRLAAAGAAPAAVLAILSTDPDPWVRRAAALRRGIAP